MLIELLVTPIFWLLEGLINLLPDMSYIYPSQLTEFDCLYTGVQTLALRRNLKVNHLRFENNSMGKNRKKKEKRSKPMENYRKTSHAIYDIKYHIVWITKYRKSVMTGKIATRLREQIRQICQKNEVQILSGHVSKDHVHMLVSVPPYLSVSKLVQYLKGTTSYKLQREFKELNKQYWGRHLWGRGYFVASSGNVTDEVIMEYIMTQEVEELKNADNFNVTN
jgi:putative transposase